MIAYAYNFTDNSTTTRGPCVSNYAVPCEKELHKLVWQAEEADREESRKFTRAESLKAIQEKLLRSIPLQRIDPKPIGKQLRWIGLVQHRH